MKVFLKNNLFIVLTYLGLDIVIFGLGLFLGYLNVRIHLDTPVSIFEWLWALLVFGIYVLLGHFILGKIIKKHKSKFKDLSSFSLIIIMNLILWWYCDVHPGIFEFGWEKYFILLPFTFPFYKYFDVNGLALIRSIVMLISSIIPCLFLWLGMELKSKSERKLDNNAIPGN